MATAAHEPTPGPPVRMLRDGQFLFLSPQAAEALAPLHTARIVSGASLNGHGYRAVPMGLELFTPLGARPDGTGEALELACRAGLHLAVRRLLARAGHPVVELGETPEALPAPNRSLLKKKTDRIDEEFLDLVRRRDRALFGYNPSAVAPGRLIAQLALAWGNLNITAGVKRIDEAYRLLRQLRPFIPDVECYHTDHHPWKQACVAITTYDYLDHGPIHLFERDIIVVLNAREGTGPDLQQLLARAVRARLYGLLPLTEEPSPFEQDQLVKLYGFERLLIPGHGQRVRPVKPLFLRATGKVNMPAQADLVERLRRAVWKNPVRNRRIARLARLLAAGNRQPLWQQFPAVAASLAAGPVRGVVVLVDVLEHALALARQLPGWEVLTSPEQWLGGLPAAQTQALANNADPFPVETPTVIATGDGVGHVHLADVDVVVRADGGAGIPPLPAAGLVEPTDGPARPLLLIGFVDRDDAELKRRAGQRRGAYAEAGWYEANVDPVQARVDAFLAARR